MTRMPVLKLKEVIAILEKAGYHIDHITGSHYIMRHPDRAQRIPLFLIMLKTSREAFYTLSLSNPG